jgi:hypothetical protein
VADHMSDEARLRRISEAKKGIDTAGIALAALARLDIPSPNVI